MTPERVIIGKRNFRAEGPNFSVVRLERVHKFRVAIRSFTIKLSIVVQREFVSILGVDQ